MALIGHGITYLTLVLVLLCTSWQARADFAPHSVMTGIPIQEKAGTEQAMNTGLASHLSMHLDHAQSDMPTCFDSEVAAVVAASDVFNPVSIAEDREYMGAILYADGHYRYTVEAGEVGQDQITVSIRVPVGSRIVAFWHTHGAEAADRSYFSEVDTELARQWQVPFYLADYTGTLKVFAAGDKLLSIRKARRLGLPARKGFSRGRRVEDEGGRLVRITTRLHTPAPQRVGRGGELMAHNNFQFAYM